MSVQKKTLGVKGETGLLTHAALRCGQGFGPVPRKKGMAVNLCGKVAVFLMELHDILSLIGYVLMEPAPNAEPDVTAHGSLLRVSE
jgi:hypothetical protein